MVDVTPCLSHANFYLSVNPPQLVLDRSYTVGSFAQNNIYPTYFSNFYNDWPTECPILRYKLLDSVGSILNDARINFLNSQSKTTARFDIRNDAPLSVLFRIQAFTMSKDAYSTLSVRICGDEQLALTSSTRKFHLLGFERGTPSAMTEAQRYLVID